MQKKEHPWENQVSPKEKQKAMHCSLFEDGGYRKPKSSLGKVREKSGKIKFHTKNRQSVPTSSTLIVGVKIVGQLYLLFFVLTNTFCFFKCIESFPYCSISGSDGLNFLLMSFL